MYNIYGLLLKRNTQKEMGVGVGLGHSSEVTLDFSC